jgi:hypothetical protein
MRVTFANAGMPLSMGLFFTLLVLGLNSKVPHAMVNGLLAHGVPAAAAAQLAHVPPLGYLFAAFLGINPLKSLLGPKVLAHLAPQQAALITGRSFFPHLIGAPFKNALLYILIFAAVMSVIAAIASALRGKQFIHEDEESRAQKARIGVEELGDDEEPQSLLDLAGEVDGVEPLADRAGSIGPSGHLAPSGERPQG